ncbi:hypothetical protein [Hippea maritima]|uniref:Uncharacterized protein n=1 Tax=Hippea maritima (strain ATCC 700847 / DSM 10411 / MH2) TaxID=760142 RepID=F2LV68_HIPMA|nr:hypothetical protein [Hippea maritima]AEA33652.1 hypothetical protein Hipma_0682 [Hippea maritima DSM 10411]
MNDNKELISDIAKEYKLPVAYLKILVKKKIISLPPAYPDKIILNALSKIYRNEQLLRISLSRISKKRREKLITHPELDKLDKYIFNRLCNGYKNGSTVKSQTILAELNKFYSVDISNSRTLFYYKKRIKQLRMKCRREFAKSFLS